MERLTSTVRSCYHAPRKPDYYLNAQEPLHSANVKSADTRELTRSTLLILIVDNSVITVRRTNVGKHAKCDTVSRTNSRIQLSRKTIYICRRHSSHSREKYLCVKVNKPNITTATARAERGNQHFGSDHRDIPPSPTSFIAVLASGIRCDTSTAEKQTDHIYI